MIPIVDKAIIVVNDLYVNIYKLFLPIQGCEFNLAKIAKIKKETNKKIKGIKIKRNLKKDFVIRSEIVEL